MSSATIEASSPARERAPSARPTWRERGRAILTGALIAGTLDALFAVVAYVFVLERYSLVGSLQYIASGALGASAFEGGLATAGLGVLLHGGLSVAFAALFVLATERLRPLSRGAAIAAGLVYGAGIWVVMSQLVLPLSGVPADDDGGLFFVAFLLDHALFVGLPIALCAHRGVAATASAGRA